MEMQYFVIVEELKGTEPFMFGISNINELKSYLEKHGYSLKSIIKEKQKVLKPFDNLKMKHVYNIYNNEMKRVGCVFQILE